MFGCLQRVKRSKPFAVTSLWTHETGLLIKNIPVKLPSQAIQVEVVFRHAFGNTAHTPVIVTVLKGTRNRLTVLVTRNISQLHVLCFTIPEPAVGKLLHRLEGFLFVIIPYPFHPCIGNYRQGVITYHGIALCSGKLHDWQVHIILIPVEKRADKLVCPFLVDYGVKRVQCPEGVPQRESSVVHKIMCFVHLVICAEIPAVNIDGDVGMNETVIERCVKSPFLLNGGSLDIDLTKFFVPEFTCFFSHPFKIKTGYFGIEVFQCTCYVNL